MEKLNKRATDLVKKLELLPETIRINIEGYGSFAKQDMIIAIKKKTKAGLMFVKMADEYGKYIENK